MLHCNMSEHARQLIDQAHLPSNISPYSNPIPALDSPKHHPFFFWWVRPNIEFLTLECHWPQWKTTWKTPWSLAVVSFPFFFRWRLGPMNLVPSVKPGARELSESEMTYIGFFFPKVAICPPKSHHLSGFLGFTIHESLVTTDLRPSLEHMSWSNVTANILYGTWSCCNSGGLAFWWTWT